MPTKDIKELVGALRSAGHSVELTSGGHHAVRHRDGGETVFMPATPSDGRGMLNACSKLRRAGFSFRWKGKDYRDSISKR